MASKNHEHRWREHIVPGEEFDDPSIARAWVRICSSCGEGQIMKVVRHGE